MATASVVCVVFSACNPLAWHPLAWGVLGWNVLLLLAALILYVLVEVPVLGVKKFPQIRGRWSRETFSLVQARSLGSGCLWTIVGEVEVRREASQLWETQELETWRSDVFRETLVEGDASRWQVVVVDRGESDKGAALLVQPEVVVAPLSLLEGTIAGFVEAQR